MDSHINTVILVSEVVLAVGLAVIYLKARIPKETIKQQGELITALQERQILLEKENGKLRDHHIENQKAIADLQGQIKVYKELPLQGIAKSLKALESLPKEFERITNANGDRIMDSISHITVQTVENQTVNKETVIAKD